MAEARNAGISAEAQHVINSLEAHFASVKRAVETGSDNLVKSVDKAWADVLDALDKWGVGFATPAEGEAGSGTKVSAPAAGGVTGSPAPSA